MWGMLSFQCPHGTGFSDAVLSIKVVHHTLTDNTEKIIKEIARITRKGGIVNLRVPTREKALRLTQEGLKSKKVETESYLPLEGDEKEILHHNFERLGLLSLLKDYTVVELTPKQEHYRVTAKKN